MNLTARQCESVLQVANDMIRRGVPKDEAVHLACMAAVKISRRQAGMGAEPTLILSAEEGPTGIIAEVKSKVSPWLWVFSIASFAMAIINARRIANMFGDWKRRRRPA